VIAFCAIDLHTPEYLLGRFFAQGLLNRRTADRRIGANHKQKGQRIETPSAFFLRYYVNTTDENGAPVRKQGCFKLADKNDLCRAALGQVLKDVTRTLLSQGKFRSLGQRQV
jgi:hypothetical protein